MTKAKEGTFKPEILDEILKGYKGPENFCGNGWGHRTPLESDNYRHFKVI